MPSKVDVAIIGAGPYALSLAAHLSARGVEHRVIGMPMRGWSHAMPRGMLLKSEGFASNLIDPRGESTLRAYCGDQGLPYADIGLPVPLETFVDYGREFQRRYVREVESDSVTAIDRAPQGFALRLAGGGTVICRRVVLAVGLTPFRHVPDELAHLPAAFMSHSADHHDLGEFRGRDVTVVGAGASAIDLAALLHEAGAAVCLVTRRYALPLHTKGPNPRPLWERVRRPNSEIGPSWRSLLYCQMPWAFRHLSDATRQRIVRNHVGPAGGWFMRERIEPVPTMPGCTVRRAQRLGDRVCLDLQDCGGMREIFTEHVIAATGYRIDLRRVGFLATPMQKGIATLNGAPLLSSHFESTLPGLYVIGPASAASFGPVMRFVAGAGFAARRVAHRIAATRPKQQVAVDRPDIWTGKSFEPNRGARRAPPFATGR